MAKRYGTFTPKRRAALRKAQLASAAKRRHVGSRGFQNKLKKGAKYTAIGLGTAAAIGYGAGAATIGGGAGIYSRQTGSSRTRAVAHGLAAATKGHHVTHALAKEGYKAGRKRMRRY